MHVSAKNRRIRNKTENSYKKIAFQEGIVLFPYFHKKINENKILPPHQSPDKHSKSPIYTTHKLNIFRKPVIYHKKHIKNMLTANFFTEYFKNRNFYVIMGEQNKTIITGLYGGKL